MNNLKSRKFEDYFMRNHYHWIAFFDLSNDVLYTKNNIYKGLNYEYR